MTASALPMTLSAFRYDQRVRITGPDQDGNCFRLGQEGNCFGRGLDEWQVDFEDGGRPVWFPEASLKAVDL